MLRRDAKLLASCFSLWLLLAVTARAQGPLVFSTTPICATGTGITNPCLLPPAAVGTPYSVTLTVTGGKPPYSYSLISGTLPIGMTLDQNTGILSALNLSSAGGTIVLQVQATDSAGSAVSENFSLNVSIIGVASRARTGVLTQIAAGAFWGTTIYLSNTTGSTASAQINFIGQNGGAMAIPVQSLQPGFAPMTTTASTLYYVMPAYTTIEIQNTNTSAAGLLQGWADVLTTGGVGAYAVFHQALPSGFTEGVAVQAGQLSPTVTLPYDNTNNLVTAVALASVSNLPPLVAATVYDLNGNSTQYQVTLSTNGQTTFTLPALFPASANTRGFVMFQNMNSVNGQGALSGLALRFNGGVFTSLPSF